MVFKNNREVNILKQKGMNTVKSNNYTEVRSIYAFPLHISEKASDNPQNADHYVAGTQVDCCNPPE